MGKGALARGRPFSLSGAAKLERQLKRSFSAASVAIEHNAGHAQQRRANMRKFLIPVAVAASALTVAAPAAAQWAPPVYHYQPYDFGRAFSGQRFANSMEVRVQRIRGDIRAMEARRILSRS